MELALVIITLFASAVATVMTAIVLKLLRDERRRSDARVEALSRLADQRYGRLDDPRLETSSTADAFEATFEDVRPLRSSPDNSEPTQAAAVPDGNDVHLERAEALEGIRGLFAEREEASPWGRRAAIAAAFAGAIAIVAFAAASLSRPSTSAAVPKSAPDAPLELLALAHEQRGNTLTITGVVQNPRAGAAISGVSAVAQLFAADGSEIGTTRAALDFTRLQPGDDSPFVLTVPVPHPVARYRIGFRGPAGRVVSHVDRRAAGPIARNE